MADEQAKLAQSIDGFFFRSGLTARDQKDCYRFVEQLFPLKSVYPVASQGYCSFTILVADSLVVQFRPEQYRLDLQITQAARDTYGLLAPSTKCVATLPKSRMLVYIMDRITGVSLQEFRCITGTESSAGLRATMCKDFALFLAKGWHQNDTSHVGLGRIGKSIVSRLKLLYMHLPVRFRPTAKHLLENLSQVEALPWVLTHGDIVAGNIMLDPSSGHLSGLVDWAEAERLPFGLSLYGLEEFLGEMSTVGFKYYPDASELRQIFWDEIIMKIPDLRQSRVLEAIKLARDLGVFLWYGIAFDNGAIDRVVEEGKDVDEIFRLDAFLDLQSPRTPNKISRL